VTTVVDTQGVHGAPVARISAADMRAKLIPLDKVREALSTTEPLSYEGFPVGDSVRFQVRPSWNHGIDAVAGDEPVEATVKIGKGQAGREFALTKDALLEATSACGLPKGYVQRTPAKLIEDQLNYWFREGLDGKSFKALTINDERVAAFTRSTIQPFSNLRLLEESLDGIEAKYGKGEVLADYKFSHSLRSTSMRLIIPEYTRVLERTGTDDDTWSVGLQVHNSLIGETQTSIDGYLFRWWCTNGATDTRATSGTWSRRSGGQGDEVYEWARSAVDEVLGGLEHSLDKVQDLVDIPVNTTQGETIEVLRDIFTQYRVPAPLRNQIIEGMVEEENLNMYSVMQAITQAANVDGMDPGHIQQLMMVGGDLPHQAHSRCDGCHRLMPS